MPLSNNLHDYYLKQSKISDPGKFSYLFDELETNIASLCDLVQGLIFHYADQERHLYQIPNDRFHEMDTRYVQKMLAIILSYDASSLKLKRDPSKRIIGVCRDNSIFLCSILRHKKIPARLRAGFCEYIIPELYLDGICVEYWNEEKQKWCFVDTRTSQMHLENSNFNLHDLKRGEKFLTASDAWQLCRSEVISPNRFGSRMHRGLWYVRNRLLHDFALLNKQEVLIWDLWGIMLEGKSKHVPPEQLHLLDDLSQFIQANSYDAFKMQDYYEQHSYLHIPSEVLVDNPFTTPRYQSC